MPTTLHTAATEKRSWFWQWGLIFMLALFPHCGRSNLAKHRLPGQQAAAEGPEAEGNRGQSGPWPPLFDRNSMTHINP